VPTVRSAESYNTTDRRFYFKNNDYIYKETLLTANTKVSFFDLCYKSAGFLKSCRFEILNFKHYLKYYVRGKRDKLVPLMTV